MNIGKPQPPSQYEKLKELILYGEIGPNEKLTESVFAEATGTSRIPVREAMQQLLQEGFICRGEKSGFQITSYNEQDIVDLYNYREALEGMLVRLFTLRADPSQIYYLECTVENLKHIAEDYDPTALYKTDMDFHGTIARGAKNVHMEHQHRIVLEKVLYISRSLFVFSDSKLPGLFDKAYLETLYKAHEEILAVVKSKKEDEAEKVVRESIRTGLNQMLRLLAYRRQANGE